MMNAVVTIKFPSMLVNKHGVRAVSTQEKFETCGEQWVDQGNMVGVEVIDSDGIWYVIENAEKIKKASFWPSRLTSYSRRIVRVQYMLSRKGPLSLNEIKIKLLDIPGIYKDSQLVEWINSSKTIYELMQSVGID